MLASDWVKSYECQIFSLNLKKNITLAWQFISYPTLSYHEYFKRSENSRSRLINIYIRNEWKHRLSFSRHTSAFPEDIKGQCRIGREYRMLLGSSDVSNVSVIDPGISIIREWARVREETERRSDTGFSLTSNFVTDISNRPDLT